MTVNKDSLGNTLAVATILCLVCAFVVSASAVSLRQMQKTNAQLDKKNNILQVTGFTKEQIAEAGVAELFEKRFKATIINIATGEEASESCKADMAAAGKKLEDVVAEYEQIWASKSKKDDVWAEKTGNAAICTKLDKKEDKCGVKYREVYSHVFMLMSEDGSSVEKYVFPIRGNGLWSLMQGFLAVEPDFQTVAGITYYDQAETPGLGGEVMNVEWKKKWKDKQLNKDGKVALKVLKGDQTNNPNGVDGLSGATITSNGVSNMIKYWLGPSGFGPFIEKTKSGGAQ